MDVYHKGELVATPGQDQDLAKSYDLSQLVVDQILRRIRKGAWPNPSRHFQPDRDKVIKLISNLSTGQPIVGGYKGQVANAPVVARKREVVAPDPKKIYADGVAIIQKEHLKDYFIMGSEGRWIINPDKTPDIDTAYDCLGIIRQCKRIDPKYSTWYAADIMGAIEDHFPDKFVLADAARCLHLSTNFVQEMRLAHKWTKTHKRYYMTLTAHSEIMMRPAFNTEEKGKLMQYAEDNKMSQREIRLLCKQAKENGVDAMVSRSLEDLREIKRNLKQKQQWVVFKGVRAFIAETEHGSKEVPWGDFVVSIPRGRCYVKYWPKGRGQCLQKNRVYKMKHITKDDYYYNKYKRYVIPTYGGA